MQMHRPDRRDDPGDREQRARSQTIAPRPPAGVAPGRRSLRRSPGRARAASRGMREQRQRQGHGEMQARIGEARAAPADALDQPGRERPADRAGEAAPERQLRDRAARAPAVEPPERREGRVVEARAHAERRAAARRRNRPAGSAPPPYERARPPAAAALAASTRPPAVRVDASARPGARRGRRPAGRATRRRRPRHTPAGIAAIGPASTASR